MNIRKAIKADIEDINKLFIELDADGVRYQPKHFQIGNRTDDYLLEIINNPKSDFIVAVIDKSIVGFSLLYEKEVKGLSLLIPCKYAYLQDFVVKSECRNRGIGTQLLEASKKWANDKGMEYLRLSVFPTNESGIRFYKRHGMMEQMLTMECSLI
jgi:ribosomal protein S18 acetylase RimI-like enzyme